MNWKVRIRHLPFLVAVVALVARILIGESVVDEETVNRYVEYVMYGLDLLVFLGIVIDPTTKGVADSERAKEYERPA